jgi:hypothetical protein
MAAQDVKHLCEKTKERLKQVIDAIEPFLNETTLASLQQERDPNTEQFYRGFLSDMRYLFVYADISYEKIGVAIRRPTFQTDYAERILYDVYHTTINSFFYPKHECYSEEGRYAYTGQDAIRFRKKPTREVRDLTLKLSKIFEEMREDLAYYETEYIMQRRLQGERV